MTIEFIINDTLGSTVNGEPARLQTSPTNFIGKRKRVYETSPAKVAYFGFTESLSIYFYNSL